MTTLDTIKGIGPAMIAGLADVGITSREALASASPEMLTQVRGISPARAAAFIAAASGDAAPAAARPKPVVAPVSPAEPREPKSGKKAKSKKSEKKAKASKKDKPSKSDKKAKAKTKAKGKSKAKKG